MSAVGKILGSIVQIAFVALGYYLGGPIGAFIGSIVGSFASYAIQSALAPKRGTSNEVSKVNVRQGEPIRWLNAGLCKQGGGVLYADFDSAGNLWYLIVHSDSILDQKIQYYLDDIAVTVDGSGNVTTNDFCLTSKKEPYEGSGTKVTYVQIWTTTYSATNPVPGRITALDAAFPSKWTSDHKLVGTTFSVVKMKALKIDDRYKIYKWRGALGLGEPALSVVGQWDRCFDPRDVGQTNGTPATYEFRRNSVLLWAWFRTHRYGRNKSRDSINWDKVAEQADICDQVVTGLVGDHIRYQCDASIPDDMRRSDAELEILKTMDAQLVFDDDGKCWPRVGYYYAPSLSLSRNRDILGMESAEAQDGESETQGVIVRYTDADANFQTQPSAPWYNPNYYTPGQSALFLSLDILFCSDHNQAMRLGKAIGMRSQPLHKIAPTIGLRGLFARQERIANINYDNTFSGEYEIVTPIEIDPVGIVCAFGAVPVDENRWTLLPGEEKPKPVVTNIDVIAAPSLPTGVTFAYANNRIEGTFDAAPRDDVGYEFQYIPTSDLANETWSYFTVDMDNQFAYSGVTTVGEYSMRYRAVSSSGRVSDWSTPLDTIDITGGDVYDGGDANT